MTQAKKKPRCKQYPDVLCRHCNKTKVNRPRGLCWSCYYRPGVRDLYPSTSKFAKRGIGIDHKQSAKSAKPTRARPGTEQKLLIMIARAEAGTDLFHPDDPVTVMTTPPSGRLGRCERPVRILCEFADNFGKRILRNS